ncbi:PKD domain-containing protein [Corallococcus silvisoli]|uniref:PKD domain-containing protein n=1 Tax=Corallococcus silvisoli TaxID=2697031 RepID=UPI001377278D|nr:PKD domain-containing protein [Corallococcus silvisoli]NBD13012.1 PKD domain-containing protein [Corallococcus silvisoli]
MRSTPPLKEPGLRPRTRMVLAAGGVVAGSLLLAGLDAPDGTVAGPSPTLPFEVEAPDAPPAPPGSETPRLSLAVPVLADGGTAEDARLARVLGEVWEPVASSAFIEQLDTERPWVCAGDTVGVLARVGGRREPGMVTRWVWPTQEGRAALQPGPGLDWPAPSTPGLYPVRFQLCRDLGGRRVGVLAERTVLLDVRACEPDAGRESPRIRARQDGPATFTFEVQTPRGAPSLTGYIWDLGDGALEETSGPRLEHSYALAPSEGMDPRGFTVRVRDRTAPDADPDVEVAWAATAFVSVRPAALPELPPRVELRVSRWRPEKGGGGWRSEVSVVIPRGAEAVTWTEVERILVRVDRQRLSTRMPWERALVVEESLERGGFRGTVAVHPEEVTPDIQQVLDVLHGRDARGEDVVVSWASFKQDLP